MLVEQSLNFIFLYLGQSTENKYQTLAAIKILYSLEILLWRDFEALCGAVTIRGWHLQRWTSMHVHMHSFKNKPIICMHI